MLGRLSTAYRRRAARWFRQRQGLDTLPLQLRRRRLYILPTRTGLGFGVLILFMLLAGLNYGNSLALLATFILMGFVFVGIHHTHRNLEGLRIVAANVTPAFAGETSALTLTLDAGGGALRPALEFEADGGVVLADIEPGSSIASLRIDVATPRRGLQPIERIGVATRYPFGLFRAWSWLHLPLAITVYPAARGALPAPLGSQGQELGQSDTAAGNDEWAGMRPFRDGDSPRQVVWTAYARELPLMVKEYVGAASEWQVFDFAALTGLDTELRLEQLCRWIVDADRSGRRYALKVPGCELAADAGSDHRHRCLSALALYRVGDA